MYAALALAAVQLIGGYQQADIIRKNGDLQTNVNNLNAQFADLDAFNATKSGYSTAARYQSVVDQTQGAVRGAYASEGVAVGYGTAGEVEKDNHIAGLMNTLQIQRNARDTAMGYQTQAMNIRLGGQMTQLQSSLSASASESSGALKAIGTGITGYQMDNLSGRGKDKDSGTSDRAWTSKASTVNVNSSGNGAAPPHLYDNGYGWYPDAGKNGEPGFFGKGPRSSYASALGTYSFTSETGG